MSLNRDQKVQNKATFTIAKSIQFQSLRKYQQNKIGMWQNRQESSAKLKFRRNQCVEATVKQLFGAWLRIESDYLANANGCNWLIQLQYIASLAAKFTQILIAHLSFPIRWLIYLSAAVVGLIGAIRRNACLVAKTAKARLQPIAEQASIVDGRASPKLPATESGKHPNAAKAKSRLIMLLVGACFSAVIIFGQSWAASAARQRIFGAVMSSPP